MAQQLKTIKKIYFCLYKDFKYQDFGAEVMMFKCIWLINK